MYVGRRDELGRPRTSVGDEADTMDMLSTEKILVKPLFCHCGVAGQLVEFFDERVPGWFRAVACETHRASTLDDLRNQANEAFNGAE